jgi:hypothetical protein
MGAVGFALRLEDRGAVDETVEERHGQRRVAQVFAPGVKINVGHQGRGTLAVASVDDLVKQAGRLRILRAFDQVEAKFVDDEQFLAGIITQAFGQAMIGQGGGQVVQQIGTGDVADAKLYTGAAANRLNHEGLAQARLANHDQIGVPANERRRGQFLNLHAVPRLTVEVPVKVAQQANITEPRFLDAASDAPFTTLIGKISQHAMGKFHIGPALLLSLNQHLIERLAYRAYFESL